MNAVLPHTGVIYYSDMVQNMPQVQKNIKSLLVNCHELCIVSVPIVHPIQ